MGLSTGLSNLAVFVIPVKQRQLSPANAIGVFENEGTLRPVIGLQLHNERFGHERTKEVAHEISRRNRWELVDISEQNHLF